MISQETVKSESDVSAVENEIARWTQRIRTAKDKWEPDFTRMRECMDFVAGLQYAGQTNIEDPKGRYINNMTLRMVAQKVASLYARNPEVEVTRRERLDFQLWDGSIEQIEDCMMRIQQSMMTGMPDMEAMATMQDFMHGRQMQEMVDKVCKTLAIVYRYQVDTARPEFKEQMKQVVRRTVVTGVGYCRPCFISGEPPLSTVETRHTDIDRSKRATQILNAVGDEEIEPNDPQMETLRSLVRSLGGGTDGQAADIFELNERIEFDFPPSTAIIPDPRCRSLKDFTAARWIAQEFILPLDEVNEFFGLSGDAAITVGEGSKVKLYDGDGNEKSSVSDKDPQTKNMVCLWEVMDYSTKSRFFIVEGHKEYVSPPEDMWPAVSGFWQIFALTFNDHEHDTQANTSPFPQSDVQLVKSAQREWNRTRDALRDQRCANAPKYLTRKNVLTEADKEKLRTAAPNSVIELEAIPTDMKLSDVVMVMQVAQIDPNVYDTGPLEQDMMLGAGVQQADLGPAQPDVTATVGTIAEQNRLSVTSSNVDDLDGFLSRVARACGEMLLQGMDAETVRRIAGNGAVWPDIDRSEYLNSISVSIKAASSGRPNKALEIANYERLAPGLQQAGANPIALIEEGVRRLDDRLDVTKFFPLPGMSGMMGMNQPGPSTPPGQPQSAGAPTAPKQPLQALPSGSPVPLAAA